MSLVARHLEENGIPTVIIGAARDIVENCGVPRFVFTDFPLGNPCGESNAADMQRQIVASAIDLLESADGPRTTVQSSFVWHKGEKWKDEVFTEEHPWQNEEVKADWLKRKELYRDRKVEGE